MKKKMVKHESFLYMRKTPALSWRLDPDDSLSDWTLRVSSFEEPTSKNRCNARFASNNKGFPLLSAQKSGTVKTYFVHRTNLAVGPRRSEYFANVFKEKTKDMRDDESSIGAGSNVTRIELMPSAAACFPTMLDYLYGAPGAPLDVSTKTAIALRHLASSFGIKSLFNETSNFIQKDLNPETAAFYMLEARKFKNEKVATKALSTIAKDFKVVKLTALSSLPPQYILDIIQSDHFKSHGINSEVFSSKIAAYCRCRHEEITLPVLEAFTDSELMPTISEEESLYYLEFLVALDGTEELSNSTSLYARCLEQAPNLLSRVINKTADPTVNGNAACRHQEACLEIYNKLPDRVKVCLLETISKMKKHEGHETVEEGGYEIRRREKKMKEKMIQMREEMENMKREYDIKLEYLQKKLASKDEELMKARARRLKSR